MKKLQISLNIACIVLSTILAIMCFYASNWNVDTICYTFGFLHSLFCSYLVITLNTFLRNDYIQSI